MKRFSKATKDYIRSKDMFGHPINLNYQGSDTFQTLPGGVLSIFVTFCVVSYCLLKFSIMQGYENWNLVQQNVIADWEELNGVIPLKDYTNVSMVIEFEYKTVRKATKPIKT